MTPPDFKKCPDCGMDNTGDPTETAVHKKDCRIVARAIDTPLEAKTAKRKPKQDKILVFLLVARAAAALFLAFVFGMSVGEENGRKQESVNTGFYKDLYHSCQTSMDSFEKSYTDQAKMTRQCLGVFTREEQWLHAVGANERGVKLAEDLESVMRPINQ